MSTHKYFIIFGKVPIVNSRLYKWYCIKAETKFEAELTLQEILNCPKKVYDEDHIEHIYNGKYFIYYSSYNDVSKDDFTLVEMEYDNPVYYTDLVIMNDV